jgi:hypothetical protein
MADRYWVGGTGTWNNTNTNHWSATSGGPNGASVPTSADNVFFNSASAAGNYTVSTTIGQTLSCLNLTIAKAAAGNVTFIDTGTFAVAGNLDITGTGVTWSAFGNWTFTSTGARTIKTDGIVLPAVTLNGTGGGSWQLLSDLSTALTQSLTLTAGTLNLNNFNLRCGQFSSNNSNVRSLVFGTGVVNLTGSGVLWSASSNTNFTMTGSRVLNAITATTSGVREIQVGTWTATTSPSVNVTGGTARFVLTGSFLNLNTTGFTGQIDGGTRTIHGNLTLGAGSTTQSSASATTFAPTSITSTVTTNGVTVNFPVRLNGPGGTLQFADTFTIGAQEFTLVEGTLDLNAQTVNLYSMIGSGTGTRAILTTGATFNLTGISITIWNVAAPNFTITPNSVINLTYTGSVGTRTVTGSVYSEAQAPSFNVTGGTDTLTITGVSKNLTFPGFTGTLNASPRTLYGSITLNPGMTCAASTAVTSFAATSGVQTITTNGRAFPVGMTVNAPGATVRLADNLNMSTGGVAGSILSITAGTLDLNNNALSVIAFASNNTNLRTIDFGATGVMNITIRSGTTWLITNATNFSYTGTGRVNLTAAFGTIYGTRVITHGIIAGGSIATKAPPFYISGGDGSIDLIETVANGHFSDIVFTNSLSRLSNTVRTLYGNFVLVTGMTLNAGANTTTFAGDGNTQTLDTGGTLVLDFPIIVGASGVTDTTLRLGSNATIGTTRTLTLFSGNLDCDGYDLSVGNFVSSNTNTRTIDLTDATVSITGSGGQWTVTATNLTLESLSSTIDFTSTTTTTRTFTGGGLTYNNLNIGGTTGTSILNIVGDNTFTGTVSSTKTVGHTIQFVAGSTNTINNWTVNGTSGNLVTITSATGAGHNLVKSGAETINVQYTNIRYSNASPANKWYALIVNNNVDLGDNTGWVFVAPSTSSSNFFLLF